MSFQTYLRNIESQTGKSPDDFLTLAAAKGYMDGAKLRPDVKAGQIIAWLAQDFGLGQGHAMAVYALLSGKKTKDSL